MERRGKKGFGSVGRFVGLGCMLVMMAVLPQNAAADEDLSNTDCIKCHAEAPQDIATNGGKHQTEVTCMECHEGHPPRVMDIIPACNNCHDGEDHYALENCLGCHSNPHKPLELTLTKDITEPCLTCHTEQREKLVAHESFHTTLACTACHDVHGKIPECVSCHDSHGDTIVQADCNRCHEAHKPLAVVYSEDVPSNQCATCHEDAFTQLAASPAKHHDVACATCHQEQHTMVPECADCHGKPHPDGILSKFPTCGDCHGIAHDLNNWED